MDEDDMANKQKLREQEKALKDMKARASQKGPLGLFHSSLADWAAISNLI